MVGNLVIFVPESYSFRYGFNKLSLPEGAYRPVLEDEEGVYFESPSKVMSNAGLHDGGIYIKHTSAQEPYFYMTIPQTTTVLMPKGFRFKLDRI